MEDSFIDLRQADQSGVSRPAGDIITDSIDGLNEDVSLMRSPALVRRCR